MAAVRIGGKLIPLLSTVWLLGLLIAAAALWIFYKIAGEVLEKETQSDRYPGFAHAPAMAPPLAEPES